MYEFALFMDSVFASSLPTQVYLWSPTNPWVTSAVTGGHCTEWLKNKNKELSNTHVPAEVEQGDAMPSHSNPHTVHFGVHLVPQFLLFCAFSWWSSCSKGPLSIELQHCLVFLSTRKCAVPYGERIWLRHAFFRQEFWCCLVWIQC